MYGSTYQQLCGVKASHMSEVAVHKTAVGLSVMSQLPHRFIGPSFECLSFQVKHETETFYNFQSIQKMPGP